MAQTGAQFDRLSSTLFVAILAHGIIILGVTFAPLLPNEISSAPALNVTLLVDTDTLEADTRDAEILSARNQAGGGNDDNLRPTRELAAEQRLNQLGEPLGVDTRAAEALAADLPVDQIVSRNDSTDTVQAVPDTTDQPAPVPMSRAALLQQSAPETLAAEIDLKTSDGPGESVDIAAPQTRESLLAAYIVGWRQRVERVGTANFPRAFLDGGAATQPVVEVTIGPEGTLENSSVVRSSGNPSLDQATLEILALAQPFEPLPEAILAEASVLKFRYEWFFSNGEQAAPRVR